MNGTRRLWPVIATSVIGIVVLCGLGAWQIERLHWKEKLIAAIASKADAESVGLAEADARAMKGEDIEFLKVSSRGRYIHDREKLMIAVYDGNPGWEVVTPLATMDGTLVLVDRGLIPDDLRDRSKRAAGNPEGDLEVTGIIRKHNGGRGLFSPDNDSRANMWFWWDIPAMLAGAATPSPQGTEPYVIQLLPTEDSGFPRPQAIDAGLRNNHLQYAITWFSLAFVLLVIASLYVRGQMKKSGA
jgi:surfeit locus 1 family protein